MSVFFKAVIFDFDGVVANTASDIASSVNAALTEFGFAPIEEQRIITFVGDGARTLLERALAWSKERAPRRVGSRQHGGDFDFETFYRWYVDYYRTHSVEKTVLYPGIAGLLELLQIVSIPAAVVSNKPVAVTREILEKFELTPFFTAVVGPEQIDRIKPAPDGLFLALKMINAARSAAPRSGSADRNVPYVPILPAETLMVGDSATDIQAGRAAGCATCAVTGGFGNRAALDAERADMSVCLASELMVPFSQV